MNRTENMTQNVSKGPTYSLESVGVGSKKSLEYL